MNSADILTTIGCLLIVLGCVMLMDTARIAIRRNKAAEQGAEQVSDNLHGEGQ